MTVKKVPPTTLAKLRSGAPEALAALCDSRGAAVYAYCKSAVGDALALEATAEAFAQLRVAILAPGSVKSKQQAEQLLRRMTRRTAMSYLDTDATERPPRAPGCDGREADLLGYVEDTLLPTERTGVDAHVEDCEACADTLRRIVDAEDAFAIKPGTRLPHAVAMEILTALATAAPVTAHGGDAIAVRDEALLLRDSEEDPTGDAAPAPERPEEGPTNDGVPAPERREPSPLPERPQPEAGEAPAGGRARGPLARLRQRVTRPAPHRLASRWPRRLLREAVRIVAAVAVAAVAGLLIGTLLAAITVDEPVPSPASETATTTTPGSPEKLPVEILSVTARPSSGDEAATRLSVSVRVQNGSGRAVRPERPELLIGDRRVPAGRESARELLTASLAADATAEGTLRFDVSGVTASELRDSRARLRLFGKTVVLPPVRGPATSAG